MKKILSIATVALAGAMMVGCCCKQSAPEMNLPDSTVVSIDKVDPPCWFTGMKNPSLQVMLYGEGVGNATNVVTDYAGVQVDSVVSLDSKNYLLVYLNVAKAQPGEMNLYLVFDNCKQAVSYELRAREVAPEARIGFDASDVLYMLMPDRFANGDPSNDNIEGMSAYVVDRNQPNARHGGDIKGITDHLDYFNELGVTALWFTPVLENNMGDDMWGEYLKSDIVQVAHHGMWPSVAEIYEDIKAEIVLFPDLKKNVKSWIKDSRWKAVMEVILKYARDIYISGDELEIIEFQPFPENNKDSVLQMLENL